MTPTRENDHAGKAVALLTDQFRGRRIIEGLLRSYVASVQTLEATLWDVLEKRYLDTAEGAQLDTLGLIVGELRQGRGDADYVAALRLRIRVNRSQGTANDVIEVATLAALGSPVVYAEYSRASFKVRSYELEGVAQVAKLLGQTRAAGTRGLLNYSTTWPTSQNCVFGAGAYGSVAGASTWGGYGVTGKKYVGSTEVTP